MYKPLLLIFSIISCLDVFSQNFTGQWKGSFADKSSVSANGASDQCDYVLELEVDGKSVSGSSYTYFTEGGKKFYTICKVEGFIDPKKKYIEITETVRTKTNIPLEINNCLQVHKLTYFKQGTTETIEGKWVPAPNQTGNCGFGTTFLTRRSLVNTYPSISKNNVKNDVSKNTPVKKITPGVVPNKSSDTENTTTPQTNQNSKENIASTIPDSKKIPGDNTQAYAKLEKRKNNIIKTIQVESSSVKVDLYDNGEIDGDSISLFFNKILLLTNKKLSDKPLSMILDIDEDEQMNELVMYAENLGSIPPNTALMIVTDGTKRYEVRITSDLEKSGVINFVHKKTSN